MAPKKVVNPQVKAVEKSVVTKSGGLLATVGGAVMNKAMPYLPPWISAAVLPPVFGFATHEMWGDTAVSAGLASAGIGLAGVALTAVTWNVAGGNNKFRAFRRAQATASVAAGMGWLTCATAAGPFGHPLVDLWLLGGGLFAASWNVRQVMRNAADETEQVENSTGFGKLGEALNLEKFQLKRAKGNGKGIVTADIAVPAGHTLEEVQNAAPKIAAAFNLPTGSVTVTRDHDNAGAGKLQARVADLLKDGVQFIPPARLGLLPTADIPVGLYADGETVLLNPFDAKILQHLLVMGVTGAGKSEFARTVLAHLMTRAKLSIWLVDLAKGRQTLGHMADGLDWFVTDKREAKSLVNCLEAVIAARGTALADEGLDQWTPKSKLNAMVVWLEEAADLADFDKLEKIARAARSVGIWLVVSLQRATWANLSTDVRANLQATACFGVDDAGDASFCLPDRVTESGAIPDWGSDRPGYGFFTGMGIPAERWTQEARGTNTEHIKKQITNMVRAAAPFRDPLDEVSAQAAGLGYLNRAHKGTNRANTTAQVVPSIPVQPVEFNEEEAAMAEEIEDAYSEVMALIPGDPEPDAEYATAQLEDDGPEPDPETSLDFGQVDKPSTEKARAILYGEIDNWARNNRLTFEPADLIPATVQAGRKRAWLQLELKKLTEQGCLSHDRHGEYTIVQSPLVSA